MTLSAAQSGGHDGDLAPLDVFAAVLAGPLDGYETSVATFFGGGSRAAPAAVVADAWRTASRRRRSRGRRRARCSRSARR